MKLRWDRIFLLLGVLGSVLVVAVTALWSGHAAGSPASKISRSQGSSPSHTRTTNQRTTDQPATLTPRPGAGGCPATPGRPVGFAPHIAPRTPSTTSSPQPNSGQSPKPSPKPTGPAPGRAAEEPARTVALTFDDGPSIWTPQILRILREQHVPATFFVIGQQVHRNPGPVLAAAAQGDLIGNHTWSHRAPAGDAWDVAALGTELARTNAALHSAIGTGTCWFRPPEGIVKGTAPVARRLGLAVALWSVDTEDWKVQKDRTSDPDQRLSRRIALRALAGAGKDHPVVLLHDGGGYRGATAAALPSIIAFYRASGYTFVRLDGR